MTYREALSYGVQRLRPICETQFGVAALLARCASFDNDMRVFLVRDDEVPEGVLADFKSRLARRLTSEPLHYILGSVTFLKCEIAVDARALIPRNETEYMAQYGAAELSRMAARMKPPERPRVLDMCTGSGAIAIALKAAEPRAIVHACDISQGALALARENAARNGVDVGFFEGDMFHALDAAEDNVYDMIISNPPYVRTSEIDTLSEDVRREPRIALDGGADGLDFIRRIAAEAPVRLRRNGVLYVEIGQGQLQPVREMFWRLFDDVFVYNDIAGIPRVLRCQKSVEN